MMKKKTAMLCAAVLMTTGILAACSGAGPQAVQSSGQNGLTQTANVISATGEGKVQVTPDMAELAMSITTEGEDAETVRDQNQERYNQVVAFLQERGIEEQSIATTDVYLNPQYDWSGNTQTLVGYTMETDIQVSDIPLEELGSLMDEAVSQGINGIRSVSYLSSQFDEKYNEALTLAVEHARSKAEAMAKAGGVSLGGLVNVTEYGGNTAARYTKSLANTMVAGAAMEEAATDTGMNIMPGELTVEANINAVFSVE